MITDEDEAIARVIRMVKRRRCHCMSPEKIFRFRLILYVYNGDGEKVIDFL